jgi:hypothetical protein
MPASTNSWLRGRGFKVGRVPPCFIYYALTLRSIRDTNYANYSSYIASLCVRLEWIGSSSYNSAGAIEKTVIWRRVGSVEEWACLGV